MIHHEGVSKHSKPKGLVSGSLSADDAAVTTVLPIRFRAGAKEPASFPPPDPVRVEVLFAGSKIRF